MVNADYCLTVDTLADGDNLRVQPCGRTNLSQQIVVAALADGGELPAARLGFAALADPSRNVQVGRPAPDGKRSRGASGEKQGFYLTAPVRSTWKGEG